jgi:DnaJ-class molecular chaperone
MANKKDYYDILGLSKTSSADDIKKTYRKLAREHHPDMVAKEDKAGAEKRFKEINEAYQVLSDPEKKKMYDQFGHAGFGPGGAGNAGGPFGAGGPFTYTYSSQGGDFGFDPFDIFEEAFGFRGFRGARRPRKGKNLYYELHVAFVDAVKSVDKEINIESGKLTIKIPQGARNGTELRFAGKGMPGPDGIPPGDLFISLRVATPKQFQRVGDNLATAIEIDFIQAILGDTVEVPVVDPDSKDGVGKAKLKIPVGTQPGMQFRLQDKGMPRLRSHGRGDVVVQTFIKIPKRLNKKQKKLLEDYKKL